MRKILWVAFALTMVAVLADAVTTVLCLNHPLAETYGIYEANPISFWGFNNFGIIEFLSLGIFLRLLVSLFLIIEVTLPDWAKTIIMASIGIATFHVAFNNFLIYSMLEGIR